MPLLLLFLLFSCTAWSQNDNLKYPLQKLMLETSAGFNSTRAGIKKIENGDTIFYSNFFLEGTYDAEIEKSAANKENWIFTCTIDSSNVKGARKSVEKWRKKLRPVLGKEFQLKKIEEPFGARGFLFTDNRVRIMIFQVIIKQKGAFSKAYIIIGKEE